jgi:TM2 domain-containing membrane protein YozV
MYYLRQQTRVSGPFSLEQVRMLLHKGRAARSDKVSTDRETWRPIGEVQEIVEHVAAAAAAPSPAAEPVAVAVVEDGYEWFYAMGGVQQPASIGTVGLRELIAAGQIAAADLVWREGFGDWQPISAVGELADAVPSTGYAVPGLPAPHAPLASSAMPPAGRPAAGGPEDYQMFVAKKVPAGLVALLMGTLGIHKFMLGLTTAGIVTLLLFFLLVPIPVLSVIALVEGIIYLTKSDAKFYDDYAVRKKQWF